MGLFKPLVNSFEWKNVETFVIRSQYNEILNLVLDGYAAQYAKEDLETTEKQQSFRNKNNCLTIERCQNIVVTGAKNKKTATIEEEENADMMRLASTAGGDCFDSTRDPYFLMPRFIYERKLSLKSTDLPNPDDFDFATQGLTVGAVLWLYYYERMGIFRIAAALMDDYNYRGKYTISGSRKNDKGEEIVYSTLMDKLCTLYRLGISSNLKDRTSTYQRVLGVDLSGASSVESNRNVGFMQLFNRLIDYMLEYYRTKQLAQAIQSQQPGNIQARSSVATQTSIRDTITSLKQQFEQLQYGRNQINTFFGIATVHITICLLNMLKAEIGIPMQYEKPEEFIPAAYDILVARQPKSVYDTNRYLLYDNCASYGYRLLTDIETAKITDFRTVASGSVLDLWLNDVEGIVEGYRNAYASLPESAAEMISNPY